jgi:hypothetical protein
MKVGFGLIGWQHWLLGRAFWFGVVLLILGNIITFAPTGSANMGWYVVAACFLLAGLAVPQGLIRILAAALILAAVLMAVDARRNDLRYEEKRLMRHHH